jgi:hypothetical protein
LDKNYLQLKLVVQKLVTRILVTVWDCNIARLGRGEACKGFWWENLRERDHWGDPGVYGRIIL